MLRSGPDFTLPPGLDQVVKSITREGVPVSKLPLPSEAIMPSLRVLPGYSSLGQYAPYIVGGAALLVLLAVMKGRR